MTNLEIIKYLATNNPARLAQFFDDMYNDTYLDGYNDDWDAKPNFNKWLGEDASKCRYYDDHELEEWYKAIHPTYTIIFNGGKLECKDGKLSMQRDDYEV